MHICNLQGNLPNSSNVNPSSIQRELVGSSFTFSAPHRSLQRASIGEPESHLDSVPCQYHDSTSYSFAAPPPKTFRNSGKKSSYLIPLCLPETPEPLGTRETSCVQTLGQTHKQDQDRAIFLPLTLRLFNGCSPDQSSAKSIIHDIGSGIQRPGSEPGFMLGQLDESSGWVPGGFANPRALNVKQAI